MSSPGRDRDVHRPSDSDERAPIVPDPAGKSEPRSDEPSDHDLIRCAQAGDELAFATLVRRHERRAYRVARNMVPGREDALDLAQEAFLRVFRSLDRFDFRHEFTTWLYRIVTNLGIDHLRKRRPAVSTSNMGPDEEAEMDLPDASVLNPSERMESLETAALVRQCIDNLAPHFRAVLTLRELEGLSCIEIADIVGATHVTVRWRLHRGRKLFQEEWARQERLRDMGVSEDPESTLEGSNNDAGRA